MNSWYSIIIVCICLFQVDDASTIKNSDIAKELSLPPVKLHCSSECKSYVFDFAGLECVCVCVCVCVHCNQGEKISHVHASSVIIKIAQCAHSHSMFVYNM